MVLLGIGFAIFGITFIPLWLNRANNSRPPYSYIVAVWGFGLLIYFAICGFSWITNHGNVDALIGLPY